MTFNQNYLQYHFTLGFGFSSLILIYEFQYMHELTVVEDSHPITLSLNLFLFFKQKLKYFDKDICVFRKPKYGQLYLH